MRPDAPFLAHAAPLGLANGRSPRRAKTGRLIDLVEQLRDILKSRGKPKWNPAPFLEVSDQVFVSVHRSNDLTYVY